MPIDFYYTYGSPPCRAVQLTAAFLGVELELKRLYLKNQEHFNPEFLKINPDHLLPTIVDGDFCLWESRAIMIYLAEKYGKDENFYPKDLKKRAIIHQRMFFDATSLFVYFNDYYLGGPKPTQMAIDKMINAMKKTDKYLEKGRYIAGDNLTLADFGFLSTLATYEVMGFDFSDYPNIPPWLSRMKSMVPDYEEIDGKQCIFLKTFLDEKRKELEKEQSA